MALRAWMTLIMGLNQTGITNNLPLEFVIFDCLHSSIYNINQRIGTKISQNKYDCKILDEFNYGCNWTRATRIIALELEKMLYLNLFTSTYSKQGASILVKMYVSKASSIMGSVRLKNGLSYLLLH